MSADIIEGFLCPICMKDLGTVTQLQGHFEESHSSEDKAVFNQLKGFFDKAKKRILGDKEGSDISESHQTSPSDQFSGWSGYDPSWWEEQELGAVQSHTFAFKSMRDARMNHFVVETNKLLIRLDKLLSPDAPTDPKKRKAFEKGLVTWIPDNEVPACLTCCRSFSLLTRRHHCRLCGGIMCDRCSQFMSASFGQKLVNPSHNFTGDGFLKRTNSNTSLNSLISSDGETHMRVCNTCRRMLERRDKMVEMRNTKPMFVQLYDKMKSCIQDAEAILPGYLPMVDSLCQGETIYSYRTAQIERTKLVRLYEVVDQLSKKILMMNANQDPPPNGRQLHLQKAIRIYASNFMQDNLMGLQALPTEEEYNKLREERTAKIQQKIAAERQAALEAQEREKQERDRINLESLAVNAGDNLGHRRNMSGGDVNKKNKKSRILGHSRNDSADSSNVGSGWKPSEEVKGGRSRGDPMLEQMDIIRGYIQQAKQAHRTDEVSMLEQNLKDLQQEYLQQQQQQLQQ